MPSNKFQKIIISSFIFSLFSLFFSFMAYAGPHFMWKKRVKTDDKLICLTFDDGPNGEATEKVLDVFKKHQIKATFFVIGKNVERSPELARRIVKEEHLLGNHSYTTGHFLAFNSTAGTKQNLVKTNQAIIDKTGIVPQYFRPPNGLMTNRLNKVCKELGLTPVGVNVFVFDNLLHNPKNIAKKVMKKVKGGPLVIVLHDGFGEKVDPSRAVVAKALEIIIPQVEDLGYHFAQIDKCVDKLVPK